MKFHKNGNMFKNGIMMITAVASFLLFAGFTAHSDMQVSTLTGNIVEVVRYYETGEVLETGFIENGRLTGKWMQFSKEGMVLAEANYKKGQKNGVWKIYDASGNLCYEMQYKNNVRIYAKCHLQEAESMSLK